MAKKKPVKKVVQKNSTSMQYWALGVVLVLIGLFTWYLLSKPKPVVTETSTVDPNAMSVVNSTSPACDVFDSIPAAKSYDEAPKLLIDEAKQYYATIKLAKGGQIVLELYPAKAPITVNSFAFLSCKGFYDGVTFHRVLQGFMAQGGDPDGTGMGGPGYIFKNEDSDLVFDKAGVLAMANAGRDTNGSQFFITFAPADFLNGGYTIFGQVVEGMGVLSSITLRDPDSSPSYAGDAIETIEITQK